MIAAASLVAAVGVIIWGAFGAPPAWVARKYHLDGGNR